MFNKKNFKKSFGKIAAIAVVFSMVLSSVFAMSRPSSVGSKENVETAAEVLTPQRIISLSPAATEILFAVGAGDKVVAVDEFSDFPVEAKELPKIGGFDGKTLSFEKILSFEPDLVYITKGMHDFLIPKLEEYGIAYYISTGASIDDVRREITEMGSITGNKEEAKAAVSKIDEDLEYAIDAVANRLATTTEEIKDINVYYETWNDPYMSVGGNTFISDVITKAGGNNIFSDLVEWPQVSEEAIIARDPDVILIPASSGVTAEAVAAREGWKDISAVKNNKVIVVDDNLYSRPSPRIGETVKQLSDILNK